MDLKSIKETKAEETKQYIFNRYISERLDMRSLIDIAHIIL